MFVSLYSVKYIYDMTCNVYGLYIVYNNLLWKMTSYTYLTYMLTFLYISQNIVYINDGLNQ